MKPSLVLRGGSGPIPINKHSHYLGHWGHLGGQPQKGIITYGLAPNRQNPLANAANDAIFNTWRRFYSQVFYWAPPLVAGYLIMDWANKRNHYLNSKAGRAEFGSEEEE